MKAFRPADRFLMARDWVASFVGQPEGHESEHPELDDNSTYIDEVASMLTDGTLSANEALSMSNRFVNSRDSWETIAVSSENISAGLQRFHDATESFAVRNRSRIRILRALEERGCRSNAARNCDLEEFKPRVLTSFVRNKLINDTLPADGG